MVSDSRRMRLWCPCTLLVGCLRRCRRRSLAALSSLDGRFGFLPRTRPPIFTRRLLRFPGVRFFVRLSIDLGIYVYNVFTSRS